MNQWGGSRFLNEERCFGEDQCYVKEAVEFFKTLFSIQKTFPFALEC